MTARHDDFMSSMVAWLNDRLVSRNVVIDARTPLFAGGLIDSIRILELIAYTEDAIGCVIPDAQIRMDNFRTIERIVDIFLEETDHVAA